MKIDSISSTSILDIKGTLARFDGDQQLLQEILGFFVEDSPPLIDELRRAVTANDAATIRSTAHALKGLAVGCGGVRAGQAAQRVENAGASGDLDEVDSLMETLEGEFQQLRRAAQACQA
jgi:HPt (histidine-containing phosphotransfer) domain-containing protein